MSTQPEKKLRITRPTLWLLLPASVLVLLISILLAVPEADDPVYNGRRLSKWMEHYPHIPAQETPSPDDLRGPLPVSLKETDPSYQKAFGSEVAEAHKALQQLGSRAFPLLLRMLRQQETRPEKWRLTCRRVLGKYLGLTPPGYHVPREQAITALIDLQYSGCDLAPIMPKLQELAEDPDPEVSAAARFLKERLDLDRSAFDKPDAASNVPASRSQSVRREANQTSAPASFGP